MTQRGRRDIGSGIFDLPFYRKRIDSIFEQGFGDGHVDMYRSTPTLLHSDERLVYQAIAIPADFLATTPSFGRPSFPKEGNLREGDGLADESSEGIGLWQRLSVELVNPLRRTVCGNRHEGDMLITGLSDGRCEIQEGRTTRDTHHHRLLQRLCHT